MPENNYQITQASYFSVDDDSNDEFRHEKLVIHLGNSGFSGVP